jgi:hypothetical protein
MHDVYLEFLRAILVLILFIYLFMIGKRSFVHKQNGWIYIRLGFGLLVFASFIDITDNYENLNQYIVIGDTSAQAFLEKVVGYLLGFLMLTIGFFKWLPKIAVLEQTKQELLSTQKALEKNNAGLEKEVSERTDELRDKIAELEKTNQVMIDRELKMIDLKEEIEKLKK